MALIFMTMLSWGIAPAQEISDKDFKSFYKESVSGSKGIVVVNFWATWCKPCIQEIPHFEKINSEMKGDGFRMILVNLDFNSKYKVSAKEFIEKRNIRSTVVHLNDSDPDKWIDKVDPSWSGAIPATVIYKDGEKVFFKEGEMSYMEIKNAIEKNK